MEKNLLTCRKDIVGFIFIFLGINHCYSEADTLERGRSTSTFKIEKVSHIPQTDATVILHHEKSLVSCVYHCQSLELASAYFNEDNSTCYCSTDDDVNIDNYENVDADISHGIRTEMMSITYIQEGSQKVKRIHKYPEPFDCLALYQQGYTEDGVYVIKPTGSTATDVWCDMTNGGWTVIQRRQDGSEDFYRNWEEYKQGFGNRSGEYWLGLETIYHLTRNDSSLYVYMETFPNDKKNPFSAFAEYTTFNITDESDNYRLAIGGYNGSCGDSMLYHYNCQFSTKDNDYDSYGGNCAVAFSGGWWYKECHNVNLNGFYLYGANPEFGRGVIWYGCWGHYYSLKKSVMKIRRN
ncbi:microfibril-associated glycoprotein 4-like [Ruditapes philippinarum]|uniref:microfibril-associated glycoprotein 4-like n=1 Tax=Ruditapes philippinarum TaxID=129788 RepID=UPI00295A581F|nr:microfibril-associated glycoprotein 4-like [Ruditapes philippinarum]